MRQHVFRNTTTSAIGIVLVVALVVMLNWIVYHWILPPEWRRSDWTSSQIYTLSEKSVAIVGGLEEEVRVVVFMTPASAMYEQVHELLDRYTAASDRIVVEYIDPDREPLKTRQLAEQFGISVADTVVFVAGDRSKYVTSDQMAEYDYSAMQYGGPPSMQAFRGEEQFTSSILSLVAASVPKVYFVTGHGEASTAGGGSIAERSLSVLDESLKRENMEVSDVSLLAGAIPEDADALAIIGPTEPFADHEIDLLRSHLDGGGRLLVCLDPLIDPAGSMRQIRLESLVADYGVAVNDDLVVDPSRRLPFFDLSAVYLTDFRSHPITTGLEGVAVLFPVTRSLSTFPVAGLDPRPLVETTSEGWGETNLAQLLAGEPVAQDDDDHPGPVAVVVAVEATATTDEVSVNAEADSIHPDLRMVVCGDSDFLIDSEIANAGNQTLALNAFNWLVARDEAVGIPPRQVELVSLYLTGGQMRLVFLITIVAMPGATILIGILVWHRRRH